MWWSRVFFLASLHLPAQHGSQQWLKSIYTPPDATSWYRLNNRRCWDNRYPTRYYTMAAAQAACLKLGAACAGVMDYGCTGQDSLFLCKIGSGFKFDFVGCVYRPGVPGWCKRRILSVSSIRSWRDEKKTALDSLHFFFFFRKKHANTYLFTCQLHRHIYHAAPPPPLPIESCFWT